ncbi:restriction endonuclease [Carbonactinospora thermoautotrophica]|uniref:site-specific DNA-methyltransferase (adenine-specific) n=1 Tax=Carbonactinospora thermoautotrophica TaxID=1469144 RepID=A0A132MRQ3_9ACTN|nr:restriction endonuclease [Carbonactinospora thermoautotrophica]
MRIEGNLLPHDLLEAIQRGDHDVPGIRPEDYHLAAGERLNHAASRKWDYLTGVYRSFRDRLAQLPETDPATTLTRERWLLILLDELGFGRLPYQRGGLAAEGETYPVSHAWQQVPIHLLGWRTELDRRTGGGKAGRAPQAMLQEFLNASDEHLWGVLSNGRQLRILRDSTNLVGAAYVEFDLEAIFDGELYSEFVLLYALAHVSRFEARPVGSEGAPVPAGCWLERWRAYAAETGERARERMRDGVKAALERLGTGFLRANPKLAQALAEGRLKKEDFQHELLRLAYQLIFCFVAEDRGVLLDPQAPEAARQRYRDYFSTARLREIAARRYGDRHTDLWQALVYVLDGLGSGNDRLGLPALGGLFFRDEKLESQQLDLDADPARVPPDFLRRCPLANADLLEAVRHLATFRDRQGRLHATNFRHLGSEELGSVYESLLELIPAVEPGPSFVLRERPGNERKTTGSYYTPDPLIQCLLDTALDPVIEEHAKRGVPDDLLKITVCDPSCGSGHFLVAAARRIAKRYAAMVTGEDEPVPEKVREAMHEVVARCVYGVDINPLAAELAKVSLWLESVRPGKPLAFLDSKIKVGNALLGVTPKLLEAGIPDEAFKPIEGDDKKIAASLRKQNEKERSYQLGLDLFSGPVVRVGNVEMAKQATALAAAPVRTLADIREQARRFRELENHPERVRRKRVADAWCAAFVWRKHADAPEAITTATLRRLDEGGELPKPVAEELDRLAHSYRFFHWHLEFPEIFEVADEERPDHNPDTGWRGGFTCVLGNPPWEKIEFKEEEFFASRRPEIAQARNAAARKKMIQVLADSGDETDGKLYAEYRDELRKTVAWSHSLRSSGRYPLTGSGRLNTYAVFAETARALLTPHGRSGLVLPTGIATDATTALFFGDLVRNAKLAAFLEFENEAFILSRDVDHSVRFCLLTTTGRAREADRVRFAFGIRYIEDLPDRQLTMSAADIRLVNPNTGTVPLFRSWREAEITLDIYRRVPVLWRESPQKNPWKLSFSQGIFNMASDAGLFHIRAELEAEGWELHGDIFVKDGKRMLPLYEAKMIHHFDHRFGTYEGQTQAQANMGTLPRPTLVQKADPTFMVLPRYWVAEAEVEERLKNRWDRGWLLGWRDICRSSHERTVIPAVIPWAAVGHTLPLMLSENERLPLLYANLTAFVLDYVARQKMAGTHLTYGYLNQLAVLPPERYDGPAPWAPEQELADWISSRVLELTYTAWDLEPFARDLGDDGPPFVWDEERRFAMRAELDAAFFHLYGVERDDVAYIMDSFRAFRNNDPERFARTKELILQVYDAMAKAMETGEPYRTILDPPPGQGPRHPESSRPDWM